MPVIERLKFWWKYRRFDRITRERIRIWGTGKLAGWHERTDEILSEPIPALAMRDARKIDSALAGHIEVQKTWGNPPKDSEMVRLMRQRLKSKWSR